MTASPGESLASAAERSSSVGFPIGGNARYVRHRQCCGWRRMQRVVEGRQLGNSRYEHLAKGQYSGASEHRPGYRCPPGRSSSGAKWRRDAGQQHDLWPRVRRRPDPDINPATDPDRDTGRPNFDAHTDAGAAGSAGGRVIPPHGQRPGGTCYLAGLATCKARTSRQAVETPIGTQQDKNGRGRQLGRPLLPYRPWRLHRRQCCTFLPSDARLRLAHRRPVAQRAARFAERGWANDDDPG